MTNEDKQKKALEALSEHETEFGVKPHERLRTFFATGEAWLYHRKCLRPGTEMPMMEPGSFRLSVTRPSWIAQTADFLDDAVCGPNGDWTEAKQFVPVFMSDYGKYVVVRHDDGSVGWFEEETWSMNRDGYRDGVYHLADSLDAFVAGLVDLDEADWDTEDDDEIWED